MVKQIKLFRKGKQISNKLNGKINIKYIRYLI